MCLVKPHIMKTRLLLGSLLSAATMLVGCQTASHQICETGIYCSKCKTVLVQRTDCMPKNKPAPVCHDKSNKTLCADCESIADTFFKTGTLNKKCPACKGTLNHCNMQPIASTGNK